MAKSDALFVTEGQCAERLGLSLEQFKVALPAAMQGGFPQPDPLFADRRYWPAVIRWLDHRYGLGGSDTYPGVIDGVENWKQK